MENDCRREAVVLGRLLGRAISGRTVPQLSVRLGSTSYPACRGGHGRQMPRRPARHNRHDARWTQRQASTQAHQSWVRAGSRRTCKQQGRHKPWTARYRLDEPAPYVGHTLHRVPIHMSQNIGFGLALNEQIQAIAAHAVCPETIRSALSSGMRSLAKPSSSSVSIEARTGYPAAPPTVRSCSKYPSGQTRDKCLSQFGAAA
jgi:hypothetical protein